MRRKCKFKIINEYSENKEFKDGYLLGFSVNSRNNGYGIIYTYPIALIETKEFDEYVLKEVPIESGNIIFEDMDDLRIDFK